MTDGSIFIGWTDHGRSRELAEALGASNFVVAGRHKVVAISYVVKAARTFRRLVRDRPSVIIFMQPPAPLLLVTVLYKAIFARESRLIADLHSGYFNDRKWGWFTKLGLRLLGDSSVLVTNSYHANLAERISKVRAVILHDHLAVREVADEMPSQRRHVLAPLSYAADEPVGELLEAAARMITTHPDVEFWLTGNAPAETRERATSNVRFLGFVSDREYRQALESASVVLALTTRDNTMQRAGYEALCARIPVVTSDWTVLREFFVDSARYSHADGEALAMETAEALNSQAAMREAAGRVLRLRIDEQRNAVEEMRRLIDKVSVGAG